MKPVDLPARVGLASLGCLIVATLAACAPGPSDWAPSYVYDVPASPCPGGPGPRQLRVHTNARPIGSQSNALITVGEGLWVVESGDNTVSPVHSASGATVDVGNGANPYDAVWDPRRDRLWITNFLADTVTVANPNTGDILREIDARWFDRPNGIALSERYAYITNTAFRPGHRFDPGSVTVVDIDSMEPLGRVETAYKNPQFAAWAQTASGPRLILSDTGELGYDGATFQAQSAAVELWRETDDPLAPQRTIAPLNPPAGTNLGAPGRASVTLDGAHAYFTSGTAPVLFKLDLFSAQWLRGPENPIILYETRGLALDHAAAGQDGLLYISSFNREELLLFDTRCDALIGAYDIATADAINAGPHDIALARDDEEHTRGYIISSIANALIEFSIE